MEELLRHSMSRKVNYIISSFKNMLYTIALILIILWLLGIITSFTLGGFIHILLVVAIILILVRLIQGKPVV
jgi:hypothetical protein